MVWLGVYEEGNKEYFQGSGGETRLDKQSWRAVKENSLRIFFKGIIGSKISKLLFFCDS